MKRGFILLSFLLVLFSQVFSIAADVLTGSAKIEVAEKEKTEKETDNESDLEKDAKDKIFHSNIISLGCLASRLLQNLHPEAKLSSPHLDTEIDPPDHTSSC
jgi:hypothetical protein